jgi:hypothetical protein
MSFTIVLGLLAVFLAGGLRATLSAALCYGEEP